MDPETMLTVRQDNAARMFDDAIVNILHESNEPMHAAEIARRIGINAKEVTRIVAKLRKQFINGKQNAVYIHLSKQGYTLTETPENLRYEGLRRLKMGTSVIMNGRYVFNRHKSISLNDYHRLQIEFQPSSIKTINLLSDTSNS